MIGTERRVFSIIDVIDPLPRGIEIFDVGAMPEGRPRYAPLLDRSVGSVTAFEPQEEERRRLESSQARTRCLPTVLGDGREHTFHVTRYPGCSSLFEPDPLVIDAFFGIGAADRTGNFHVERTLRLGTERLDDVPDLPQPDLLKLDIQGAELLVLTHGSRLMSRALVVEAEAEFVALYRDQPLFGDLHRFMADQGFWLHRLENMQGRCYRPFATDDPSRAVSQPLWCDAVFVRDPGRLHRWSDDDLLVGATILHECYGSCDLALRLLAAFDDRRRTGRATAYLAALKADGPIAAVYPR